MTRWLAPQLAIGLTIWSIGFVAIYGLNAVGCAFVWPEPTQRIVLALLAAAHILALAAWTWWTLRRLSDPARDHSSLHAMIAGTAAVAIAVAAVNFIPPLFLTLCQ